MEESLKVLAQFGVGGVLAGILFWFYRQDRKDAEQKYGALALDFRSIVEANTRAITKLSTLIDDSRASDR
jgi:hypothetical protein